MKSTLFALIVLIACENVQKDSKDFLKLAIDTLNTINITEERANLALELINKSITEDSKNFMAYYWKANILAIYLNKPEEAKESINLGLKLKNKGKNNEINGLLLRGYVKLRNGEEYENDYKLALELVNKSLRKDSKNLNLIVKKLSILSVIDKEKAIKYLVGIDNGIIDNDQKIKMKEDLSNMEIKDLIEINK